MWQCTREYWKAFIWFPILFGICGFIYQLVLAGGKVAMKEAFSYAAWTLIPAFIIGVLIVIINYLMAPYKLAAKDLMEERQLRKKLESDLSRVASEKDKLQKMVNDPILQSQRKEHIEQIKGLIDRWKASLFVVALNNFTSYTELSIDSIKQDIRFECLKEHLLDTELWQGFSGWDTKAQEYQNKCKGLIDEIKESWEIEGTETTNEFANSIMKFIDGGQLNFDLQYDEDGGVENIKRQILMVNGFQVLKGKEAAKIISLLFLPNDKCEQCALCVEYKKLADKFMISPVVHDLKQLSKDLKTLSQPIVSSLYRHLERGDWINNHCQDCPTIEESIEGVKNVRD
jgi:hypothetical protein